MSLSPKNQIERYLEPTNAVVVVSTTREPRDHLVWHVGLPGQDTCAVRKSLEFREAVRAGFPSVHVIKIEPRTVSGGAR